MELKEQAGDKDLYDVMKKKRKRQCKTEKSMAKQYVAKKSSEQINVFDFINKKLKGKKGIYFSFKCNRMFRINFLFKFKLD